MSELPNTTKEALRMVKAEIVEKVRLLPDAGQAWERMRYADNLDQWTALAAVEIRGQKTLRVAFIYLADISTERAEARQTKVTATYAIELVAQYMDGDNNTNSTLDFEDVIGDLIDIFIPDEALGFTDAASQAVFNTGLRGDGGGGEGGRPRYVDGVLSHQKIFTLDVVFRVCR